MRDKNVKTFLLSQVGFIIYDFGQVKKKVSIDRTKLSQVKDAVPISCNI